MSDDEIKETICDLVVEVQEMQDHLIEQLTTLDELLHKLKRHFCPEKFEVIKVPVHELQSLICEKYGTKFIGPESMVTEDK